MKVFRNPTKGNSVLVELSYSELLYLEAYINDMSVTDKVVFPCCFYRAAQFSKFSKAIKDFKL